MPIHLSPGVYIEEIEVGAKPIEGISTSTAGFLGEAERGPTLPTLVTSWLEYQRIFGSYFGNDKYLPYSVDGFFKNGGQKCYVARVVRKRKQICLEDYKGKEPDLPGQRRGLAGLAEIDDISIVYIPAISQITGLVDELIGHCERLKDRFAIIDIAKNSPYPTEPPAITKYGAFYCPWINITDPQTGMAIIVPPGGYIAGIYARSDIERGVHKAPANEIVRGAVSVEYAFSKTLQDTLNAKGINCIRLFPSRGIRVWGARTMSSDSLWKYINVRRLFIFLEKSIEKGTQWVVFELNNEKLWDRVKQTIINFLTAVWRNGALMGNKPQEAFFVKCDRTTMTQDDIDNGRVIVLVGVAPIKPAEFVIFRIAQWQGGSSTME